MPVSSSHAPEDYLHLLTRLLSHEGYPPAYVEVMSGAVSVWFWVGTTTIQVIRTVQSDTLGLIMEIVLEAQRRGVLATGH